MTSATLVRPAAPGRGVGLITQRQAWDGAPATAAMAAGCSYDRAYRAAAEIGCLDDHEAGAATVASVTKLLERCGGRPWSVHRPQASRPLSEVLREPRTDWADRAIFVLRRRDGSVHWVVVSHGLIFDSRLNRPRAVREYKARNALVIRALVPSRTPVTGEPRERPGQSDVDRRPREPYRPPPDRRPQEPAREPTWHEAAPAKKKSNRGPEKLGAPAKKRSARGRRPMGQR